MRRTFLMKIFEIQDMQGSTFVFSMYFLYWCGFALFYFPVWFLNFCLCLLLVILPVFSRNVSWCFNNFFYICGNLILVFVFSLSGFDWLLQFLLLSCSFCKQHFSLTSRFLTGFPCICGCFKSHVYFRLSSNCLIFCSHNFVVLPQWLSGCHV